MSVGAGLLLAGVSLKVTVDAIRLAGPIAVALSLLLGAAAFSASNALLARFGAPARWRRRRPKQQLMGHAKVDTTLNVYAQVIDGSLRRAADTVGSELVTIVPNRKMMMAGASMVMGLPSRSS